MTTRWLQIISTGLLAFPLVACGDKGSDDAETGGTGGTSTGGTSTGGSSGTGTGGTGMGGSGGSGMVPASTFFTFDADDEGWAPNYASSADGVSLVVIGDVTAVQTADDGHDDPGALAITIPYEEAGQYVGIGLNMSSVDTTGRTITAWIKLESGLGDATELMTTPGGAGIYAKSGEIYCYAAGTYNNVGDAAPRLHGSWFAISFNLARPPRYVDPNCADLFDPADIREIGIQFDANGMAPSATTAVFHLDDVSF